MVGPHIVRRVFHIPLAIVHPSYGWARVVSPSLVTIEKPSIFSSHSNDLRCICIHPRPLSSRGQGPVRAPSDKEILVLESVTRGGWLAISGFGSGSHRTFLQVLFLEKHHQVTVRWVVPCPMCPQDVWLEPPCGRGLGPWKRARTISPG